MEAWFPTANWLCDGVPLTVQDEKKKTFLAKPGNIFISCWTHTVCAMRTSRNTEVGHNRLQYLVVSDTFRSQRMNDLIKRLLCPVKRDDPFRCHLIVPSSFVPHRKQIDIRAEPPILQHRSDSGCHFCEGREKNEQTQSSRGRDILTFSICVGSKNWILHFP